jgi:uncharacterized membrane protein
MSALPIGSVVLPSRREGSALVALLSGAMSGFVAYGSYDVNTRAALRYFSFTRTTADMAWSPSSSCRRSTSPAGPKNST